MTSHERQTEIFNFLYIFGLVVTECFMVITCLKKNIYAEFFSLTLYLREIVFVVQHATGCDEAIGLNVLFFLVAARGL